MTGVFTDNQPDFAWLQPYEEKSWTQYFMPYAQVGYVKNASKDFIMNLTVENSKAYVIVYATGQEKNVTVEVKDAAGKVLYSQAHDLSPEQIFKTELNAGDYKQEDLTII